MMKRRQLAELKKKELSDLKKLVSEKRIELTKTKSYLKAGKEKNLKKVKGLRKEIAQILTTIRAKEILLKENEKGRKIKEE